MAASGFATPLLTVVGSASAPAVGVGCPLHDSAPNHALAVDYSRYNKASGRALFARANSMSKDLTIGLLGVGNIGTVHLQSAQAMPGCRVVAAADADPTMRDRARDFGVATVYDDYAALIDAGEVDAVIVALPPSLHADATVRACEAGMHVFVEKPLAPTLEDCDRMLAAAEEHGVFLGVDHTIRYQPEFQRLKARYDAGELGHVPLATITRINGGPFAPPGMTERIPAWQLGDHAGAGAVFDLGVHLFDVLEWFFGEVRVRHAVLGNQLDLPYEDTASVLLESTDSGSLVTMHVGYFQWERPPTVNTEFRLEGVTGSASTREYVPKQFTAHVATAALGNVGKRLAGRDIDVFEPTYFYQAHYAALKAFVDAVRAGERPPVDGVAGRRAVELVLDVHRIAGGADETVSPTPAATGAVADGGEPAGDATAHSAADDGGS